MTIGDEHTDSDVVEWITRISEQAARDYPGSPRTIAYGPDEQNVVDMWGPNEAPTLVVSLHGGYFAAMYDRSINDALVRAMAARGVAVANVEYRRTGSANTATDSLEDARVAVDCVLSDRAVAPQRVVVVGHSAGGWLARILLGDAQPYQGGWGAGGACVLAPGSVSPGCEPPQHQQHSSTSLPRAQACATGGTSWCTRC